MPMLMKNPMTVLLPWVKWFAFKLQAKPTQIDVAAHKLPTNLFVLVWNP